MFCFHATTSAGKRDALTSCVRSHGMLLRTIGSKPASRGCGSTDASNCRSSSDHEQDPWYDADHQTRRVRSSGEIKLNGELIFVSEALVDQLVGIAELETGDRVVRFVAWTSASSTAAVSPAAPPRRTTLAIAATPRCWGRSIAPTSRRANAREFHSPRTHQPCLGWAWMSALPLIAAVTDLPRRYASAPREDSRAASTVTDRSPRAHLAERQKS